MNCKIESMSDNRRNNVDTLPPRGRVNEVRREWLVHEDGALAYRLQDEEIKQHLVGNKSRNIQIREDFPKAKSEQLREAEEAAKLHHQLLTQQEQQDAQVAAQLAEMIDREEEERRRMLEEEDKELARFLQEKEQQRIEKRERDRRELESHTPRKERPHHSDERRVPIPKGPNFSKEFVTNQPSSSSDVEYSQPLDSISKNNTVYYDDNLSDINNVGLPLKDDIIQPLRICNLNGYSSYDNKNLPSPSSMTEEEYRRMQEEKDEELARFLQEKENLENMDTVNRDRLLAIETQDKELARLLQEKERAKARRARERAKQKAALKRMQEEGNAEALATSDEQITIKTAETVSVSSHKSSGDDNLSYKTNSSLRLEPRNAVVKAKPRYPDPEEIVELPPDSNSPLTNIAMTIDPTYSKESMERMKHKKSSRINPVDDCEQMSSVGLPIPTPVPEIVQDVNAPPYMPIQGQRRLPEKKTKPKDGCKQQ